MVFNKKKQSDEELEESLEKSTTQDEVDNKEEKIKNDAAHTSDDVVEDSNDLNAEEIDPLVQLQNENEELEDNLLRVRAEMANIQKRNTRERQDLLKYKSQKLATSLVDVIDNLERALEVEVTSEDSQALKKGVEMVYSQILNAFESEDIQTINPLNEPFNPQHHQAVSTAPAGEGQDSDIVVNVLQKGYVLHDRVLRPAMVIVSE